MMYVTNKALICLKPWKVFLISCLFLNCIPVQDTKSLGKWHSKRTLRSTEFTVCDSNAPWPNLWANVEMLYICYTNGTLTCSHICVKELFENVLKDSTYTIINDVDCSCNTTKTQEDCLKSQKFVSECYNNDCLNDIPWRKDNCSSVNCSQDCLADNIGLYNTTIAANKSRSCNCYKHSNAGEESSPHCDIRRNYIESCYELYVSPPDPPVHPLTNYWWVLILGLTVVLGLVVLVGLYFTKPEIFSRWLRNRDTLDVLAHFIRWDDVKMISKKESKEVVLKVPYRKDHKTNTIVLKIFSSHRADVYGHESQIHDKIKNVHKNIIEVFGMGEISNDLLPTLANKCPVIQPGTKSRYLMLRHCSEGSLFDVLRKKDLSLYRVLKIGLDICSALKYLQSLDIIHMDIKSSNIFVTGSRRCLLGDFGMAVQWTPTNDNVYCPSYMGNTNVKNFELRGGTYPYYPPEHMRKGGDYVLKHVDRDPLKIDVYQLGLLLWDCQTPVHAAGLKRKPPYDSEAEQYRGNEKASLETMATLFENIPNCRPLFHQNSDQSIVSIIEKCWDTKVEDRPMLSELYSELELTLLRERVRSNMCCTSYNISIFLRDNVDRNRVVSVVHGQANISVSPDVEIPPGRWGDYQI